MNIIEKIIETKQNLDDMRETKKKIKDALENKFDRDIGEDFTKYPKMINEVWSEHEKIKVGETAYHLLTSQHNALIRDIYDFSETTTFSELSNIHNLSEADELENKIKLNIRNAKAYNRMFNTQSTQLTVDPRKFFRVIGIPQTTNDFASILQAIYSYANAFHQDNDIIEIDEELDLKGRTFTLTNIFKSATKLSSMKSLPNWFCKVIPYSNNINNLNYNNSNRTITLDEDVYLEFCKETDMSTTATGSVFHDFNAPNIHFYFHNDYSFGSSNYFFSGGSCPGLIRIDGPGCLIFSSKTIASASLYLNRIANSEFVGNKLEIKFKTSTNSLELNQDFSNFKDVRFLEGTEFYSVSGLPYTTEAEWVDFFNSLPDNSTSSYSNTIKIASSYYNLLNEDDLYIATDKGYTIASV